MPKVKVLIADKLSEDGIQLLKANFIRLGDYKLETAAQEILGKGKLMHGAGRFEEIEQAKPDAVATDCPLAAVQIEQGTGRRARHPIVFLARAYGYDPDQA